MRSLIFPSSIAFVEYFKKIVKQFDKWRFKLEVSPPHWPPEAGDNLFAQLVAEGARQV